MNRNSFEELRIRYIAGEQLSSDEASLLLRWLNENPGARREMLIDEAIDNQLRCLARLDDEESAEKFILETVQRAGLSQHNETSHDAIRIQTRETNRSRSFPSFLSPAGLCAAVLIFVGIGIAWYSAVVQQQVVQQDDFGFAQITNIKNLSWELIHEDSRRLSVSSGSGEVRFANGTIARLDAPVIIELRTPSILYVKTGSVKIHVPPAAIGFTVDTPVARIVDYGTKFDVDVGEAGQTETRVRSGIVTFETHRTSVKRSDPIKLTAEGLNHASAVISDITKDVRSVSTTASGSQGQFFGTIHADGETVEFDTRQEFEDFRNRLSSSVEKNPSKFREHWKVIVQTTANSTSATVESSGGSGILQGSATGNAHEMLIKQLHSMREVNQGNPQMQSLLEDMILQAEEDLEKTPK